MSYRKFFRMSSAEEALKGRLDVACYLAKAVKERCSKERERERERERETNAGGALSDYLRVISVRP